MTALVQSPSKAKPLQSVLTTGARSDCTAVRAAASPGVPFPPLRCLPGLLLQGPTAASLTTANKHTRWVLGVWPSAPPRPLIYSRRRGPPLLSLPPLTYVQQPRLPGSPDPSLCLQPTHFSVLGAPGFPTTWNSTDVTGWKTLPWAVGPQDWITVRSLSGLGGMPGLSQYHLGRGK